jgi:CheY-like chemotaxis protein
MPVGSTPVGGPPVVPGPGEGPPQTQIKVLLVEDQDDLRETTQQLLQMLGAYTVSAASAEDAERMLERETFQLLLTDVSLPGRDGVALARAARARHPSLHIAFATGHGAASYPDGLVQSVLTKPYSIEELQQLLVRAQNAQPVA